jgi:hypothetical protein
MRAKLSITHTVNPDGSIIHHPWGMNRPNLTNMGYIMKKAAFNHVQEKTKSVNRKLKAA